MMPVLLRRALWDVCGTPRFWRPRWARWREPSLRESWRFMHAIAGAGLAFVGSLVKPGWLGVGIGIGAGALLTWGLERADWYLGRPLGGQGRYPFCDWLDVFMFGMGGLVWGMLMTATR
jgi:hypothetical protein